MDSVDPDEASEGSNSCRSPAMPPESPHSASQEEPQTKSTLKRKSRIKSSSRRTFLNCLSDEEEDTLKSPRTEGVVKSSQKTCSEPQLDENTNKESDWDILNQEASSDNLLITFGNSWMCPLTSEELSQLPSDAEREDPSETRHTPESSGVTLSQDGSKSCSGVILKLRRMFSDGLNRKGMSYQPVLDSYTHSQTEPSRGELSPERSGKLLRRTPEATNRWRRTSGGFSHALRPRSSCSKRKHRSLLKIKYCPYLSACHSAEHRRRWVLRSAVQRARRAMKIYYPDLVGKRIHHLYEEDDKSEVWYRGEVLRIHKAHPNPLKTVFEVRYDSEPGWKYYLELLIDYKKGWLKIED